MPRRSSALHRHLQLELVGVAEQLRGEADDERAAVRVGEDEPSRAATAWLRWRSRSVSWSHLVLHAAGARERCSPGRVMLVTPPHTRGRRRASGGPARPAAFELRSRAQRVFSAIPVRRAKTNAVRRAGPPEASGRSLVRWRSASIYGRRGLDDATALLRTRASPRSRLASESDAAPGRCRRRCPLNKLLAAPEKLVRVPFCGVSDPRPCDPNQ